MFTNMIKCVGEAVNVQRIPTQALKNRDCCTVRGCTVPSEAINVVVFEATFS